MSLAVCLAFSGACSSKEKGEGGSGGATASGGQGQVGGEGGEGAVKPPRPERPNFIVLLADDLGFDDRGMNNPLLETPSLDALAEESVRFENFYTQPVCATTRAALLTGLQPQEAGVWDVHGGRDFIAQNTPLLVESLRDAGYRTGMFGKWHSGFSSGYQAHERGFDDAYSAHLYSHFNAEMTHNGEVIDNSGWTTQSLVDHSIEFMDKAHGEGQPFVVYLPFLAPHEPWMAPDEFKKPYKDAGMSEDLATVFGMLSHLDSHIGRLLEHLDESELATDTVVLFMSDNGPWRRSSNGLELSGQDWLDRNPTGLRANKGEVFENGIRSPLFVRFGPHLEAGDSPALLGVQDVFPTLLEMAGVQVPQGLDGVSFAKALESPGQEPDERELFFQKQGVREDGSELAWGLTPSKETIAAQEQILALRKGDYKLVSTYSGGYELFNVASDPLEKTELSTAEPVLFEELKARLQERFSQLLAAENSYTPAQELIGNSGAEVSVLSPRTAMNKSEGVAVESWRASRFEVVGDFVELSVNVITAGSYRVQVELESENLTGGGLKISIGGTSYERLLDTSDAESWGSGKYLLDFGEGELPEGESTLRFEIVSPGSDTDTRLIESLLRFHLTAQ